MRCAAGLAGDAWPGGGDTSRKLSRMGPATTLTELGAARFAAAVDKMLAVYTAAMDPAPSQLSGRRSIMARHAANPGFRALAVLDDTGEPVAFSYGFHGEAGQWWHDMVNYALAASAGAAEAARWLSDSFEVAELHVTPAYQHQGLGRSLLYRLTAGLGERNALLSTHDAESPARHLYRSAGFVDLLTAFRFSGGDPPYAVMGAALPLRGARS
jgi:ribosomal protein S18 acetylase RimI-like enzyme